MDANRSVKTCHSELNPMLLDRFVKLTSWSVPSGRLPDQSWRQDEKSSCLTPTPAAGAAQQGHGHLGELFVCNTPIGSSVHEIMTLCVVHHQCDPTLLPEPNHVMLNHLYALSIKVRNRACFYFENQSSTPFLSFILLSSFNFFLWKYFNPVRIIEGFNKSI